MLLKHDDAKPGRKSKTDPSNDSELQASRRLICRRCEASIAAPEDLFCMRAQSPVQAFANPFGIVHEILTLRCAHGLIPVGAPSTEFSWFAGYSWQVVHCAQCGQHLGWRFDAQEPASSPELFFGLLHSELTDG